MTLLSLAAWKRRLGLIAAGFLFPVATLFCGSHECYAFIGRGEFSTASIFVSVFLAFFFAFIAEKSIKTNRLSASVASVLFFASTVVPFFLILSEMLPSLQFHSGMLFVLTQKTLFSSVIVGVPTFFIVLSWRRLSGNGSRNAATGLAWAVFGGIFGAIFTYFFDCIGSAVALIACGTLLVLFAMLWDSCSQVDANEAPKKLSGGEWITAFAGISLGLAVMHTIRAHAMFQPSLPINGTVTLSTIFLFMLIGLAFCRTEFKSGHHLLNAIRKLFGKKPDTTELGARAFASFGFVLLGLTVICSASSYEFLGLLGSRVPELLPADSVLSIVFIMFMKTAFIWGPIAMALSALWVVGESVSKKFLAIFALGVMHGVIFSSASLKLGIVDGIYIFAGAIAVFGLIGLIREGKLLTAPVIMRLSIVLLCGAVVVSVLSPGRTLSERMLFFIKSGLDIRYSDEGSISTLTVAKFENEDKDRSRTELYDDSVFMGGISAENRYLKLAGLMPSFYNAKRDSAVVLGYTTGVATSALWKSGFKKMTIYERNSARFNLQEYFSSDSGRILNESGVVASAIDPVLAVRADKFKYDCVFFEPQLFTFSGGWEMMTPKFFRDTAERTADDGMVILPITGLSELSFAELIGNFRAAFAEVHVFYYRLGTLLIGFKRQGVMLDIVEVDKVLQTHSEYLNEQNVFTAYDVVSGFICKWPEAKPSMDLRPRTPKIEELSLRNISVRQASQLQYLLKNRTPFDKISSAIINPPNTDVFERFYKSCEMVMTGIAEFLSASDVKSPERAAEHFRNALEMNQGDYEAKWFLNYLVKVGAISIDNPDEKKDESKFNSLMKTILTATNNDERIRALRKMNEFVNTMTIKDIADIAKVINDTDAGIRRQLAVLLGYFKDDLSRSTVIRLIQDEEPFVANAAISAAVAQNNIDALPQILDRMDESDLVGAAVSALRKFGSSRAAPKLAQMLRTSDDTNCLFYLAALAACGTPSEFGVIVELMSRNSERVRENALLTLRKISQKHGDRSQYPVFAAAINDPDIFVRLQAVMGLGETGGPEAYELLVSKFNFEPKTDEEILFSAEMLNSIGRTGKDKAVLFLSALRSHDEPNISSAAIGALGYTGSEEAKQMLVEMLHGDSLETRLSALTGIFNMGRDTALKILPGLLNDPLRAIRHSAMEHIAALKSKESIELIKGYLTGKDLVMAADAARVAHTTGDASLLPLLFPLLNKGNSTLAAAACESIVKLSDGVYFARFCREALGHPTEVVRIAAANSLLNLPSELPRDYAISVLASNLSFTASLDANIAYTSALARLSGIRNALRIRRDSTEEEIARTINWWKDFVSKRPVRDEQ